ncbi:hypothetical protein MRX96_005858 [Rhipicephalus microplus]
MAHREIADVPLDIAGLPRLAHARRCLVEIENAVDLPLAVNYGGAGRLIADEVLRGLLHELMYNESRSRSRVGHVRLSNYTVLSDWPPYHVDIKALLAVLSAYRLAVVQDLSSADRYVDPLYGDPRRRCNEPVKELPEFAAAFRCNLPHTQS